MLTVDFRRIFIGPGDRILDIGCGSGRHTAAAYGLHGALAVGADIRFETVLEARARLRFHEKVGAGRGTWTLNVADAGRLPFKSRSFAVVVCAEMLEHIPREVPVLREIRRVLKPGGDLLLSVPRYWPERICWRLSQEYHMAAGGHLRIYRRRQLIRLVEDAGFQCRAYHYAHALHSPYWWLKCLLGPERPQVPPVRLYHRFLSWDIMCRPPAVRWVERLINPLLGKSLVLYFRKADVREPSACSGGNGKPIALYETSLLRGRGSKGLSGSKSKSLSKSSPSSPQAISLRSR